MKQLFLTLAVAMLGYGTYAQTNTFPSSGNVGIGTTSPGSLLELVGTGITAETIAGAFPVIQFQDITSGENAWILKVEDNSARLISIVEHLVKYLLCLLEVM